MQITGDPALSGAPSSDREPPDAAPATGPLQSKADLAARLRDWGVALAGDVVAVLVPGRLGVRHLVAQERLPDGWCAMPPARIAVLRRLATQALLQRAPQRQTRPTGQMPGDLVAMPLLIGDQLRGVLVFGRRVAELDPKTLASVEASAPILAQALPEVEAAPGGSVHAAFFAAASDAALVIDHRLRILATNPAWQALTGWGNEITGLPCVEVIRCQGEQGEALCGTAGCPLQLPPAPDAHATVTITTLKGQGDVQITRASAGKQHILLLRDATGDSQAIRQRDAFLSEVSHKLRNRMNSINGFVELVASGHAGTMLPPQRQLLSYAHTSSMELVEYIENLIYLTRVESQSQPTNADTVDPAFILEEVEQHLAMEADSADIALVRDVPAGLPALRGDRMHIRQALLNLTMNAIKFTGPGGFVRLEAYREESALIFAITDSGIGIAPADQPHVFDRDYQSERTARSGKSGGGLGLAAARAIIEQHGGTIWFTTAVDHGTTFYVRFPLSR